jgi:hypothetical protein
MVFGLLLQGCVGVPTRPAEDGQKSSDPSAGAQSQAGGSQSPSQSKAKAEPQDKKAPAPQLSIEEIQGRRQIEKELERDVETYYNLVKDRNVEKALESVVTNEQEKVQAELWQFISQFTIENFDIKEKKIDFDAKPYKADVTVSLTVYEARTVSPKKKPVSSRWQYAGGRWLVRP